MKEKFVNCARKVLEAIGRDNKSTYVMVSVAVMNGICKPASSLADKKEPFETRKYAAIREFLTEVVAVPTYIACGGLASWAASRFLIMEEQVKVVKSNANFLGTAVAAFVGIPAMCSLVKMGVDKVIPNGQKPVQTQQVMPTTPVIADKTMNKTQELKENFRQCSMIPFRPQGGLKV